MRIIYDEAVGTTDLRVNLEQEIDLEECLRQELLGSLYTEIDYTATLKAFVEDYA